MSGESGQNQTKDSKNLEYKVLFDTSIIIDHLRKVEAANELIFRLGKKEIFACVSSLTEAELLAGSECENPNKRLAIIEMISMFEKINVVNEIAQTAGNFKRKYRIPLDDCIIASTAFHHKCVLWTKNLKDFEKIVEITTEEPY